LEHAEWAELLVFKAGLAADRGDLGEADRLLARAASLYRAAWDPQRAAFILLQQSAIRAGFHDSMGAADLLRTALGLLNGLPQPGEPWLLAGILYHLATQLLAATAAAAAAPAAEGPPADSAKLAEALRAAQRARTLYGDLADPAAEACALRVQGQIEAALDRLEDAEATLCTAAAALARHGLGREAVLAQVELGLVLARRGRAAEMVRLGLDRRPPILPRDGSWDWTCALMVFQIQAQRAPDDTASLQALARYLTPPPLPSSRRLARVA
jgi:hypothetical protein